MCTCSLTAETGFINAGQSTGVVEDSAYRHDRPGLPRSSAENDNVPAKKTSSWAYSQAVPSAIHEQAEGKDHVCVQSWRNKSAVCSRQLVQDAKMQAARRATIRTVQTHTLGGQNMQTKLLYTDTYLCCMYLLQLCNEVQRLAIACRQEAMGLQIVRVMEAAEMPAALAPHQHHAAQWG